MLSVLLCDRYEQSYCTRIPLGHRCGGDYGLRFPVEHLLADRHSIRHTANLFATTLAAMALACRLTGNRALKLCHIETPKVYRRYDRELRWQAA